MKAQMKTQPASGKTTFRCTKGASKQRRDSLNTEICQVRECLPVTDSLRHQLSQIQVMSLAAAYVHNASHLATLFGCEDRSRTVVDDYDFLQALPGFLLLITPEDKLLYISDNVADYLGYTAIDLLTHGGTVYDIISEADRSVLKNVLEGSRQEGQESVESTTTAALQGMDLRKGDTATKVHSLACRMKVSRSVRRQSSCDRYKLIYIRGHFVPFPQQSQSENGGPEKKMFVGFCSPQPYTQPQESTMFTTKHSMDMKYTHIDENAEYHLGYCRSQLDGKSWYAMLHPDDVQRARDMHLQVAGGVTSGSVCVRVQTAYGHFLALSVLIQPCKTKASQYFLCSNRVMGDNEAGVEWVPAHSAAATTPIVLEPKKSPILCSNSFTKLLYNKDLDSSLSAFDQAAYGDEQASGRDGEEFGAEFSTKMTDFATVDCRQLTNPSLIAPPLACPPLASPPLACPPLACLAPASVLPPIKPDVISKTRFGDKYPVLSQMLRAKPRVRLNCKVESVVASEPSLPNPPIQSVLTPISRCSSVNSSCNLENSMLLYPSTPHSVASVESSHSSHMEISENETPAENDYEYLNTVAEQRSYSSTQCLLPELDSTMLDICLWDDLSTSESSNSCMESLYEPMLSDNRGAASQASLDESEKSVLLIRKKENQAQPANDQEMNRSEAVSLLGAPVSPMEKEKCIDDRRMECLLNLVRAAMASGLISADVIDKSGNGLVSLGRTLKELKRLHQSAMRRVNSC